CVGGVCSYSNALDGTACPTGICQNGVCVTPSCATDADCNDNNDCTFDDCEAGTCAHTPLSGNLCLSAYGTFYCVNGVCKSCVDADSDGYSPYHAVTCPSGTDCNDANASINPKAAEVCNYVDDNCNGEIDEGCTKALAGDDQTVKLSSYTSSLSGSCAGKISASTPGVYSVNGLSAMQCDEGGSEASDYYAANTTSGVGSIIRKLSNVPANSILGFKISGVAQKLSCASDYYGSHLVGSNFNVYVSSDGSNWHQCGDTAVISGSNHNWCSTLGPSFESSFERSCTLKDFAGGDVYYKVSMSSFYSGAVKASSSYLTYFNATYLSPLVQFKGNASLGRSATSITKYEWDFNGDGVFDITTNSPSSYYTYESNLSGDCGNGGLRKAQLFSASNLEPTGCNGGGTEDYYRNNNSAGTGHLVRKISNIPADAQIIFNVTGVAEKLSCNSKSDYYGSHSVNGNLNVYVSSDGLDWYQCGSTEVVGGGVSSGWCSQVGTYDGTFLRDCTGVIPYFAGGDLYAKVTQSATFTGAVNASAVYLKEFDIKIYSSPTINGYATHLYTSHGTYNAMLRVTDNTGYKANDTVKIVVS
ncbi:MAG: putative metal-binding motif-containing protein, partial [archaeon]